jgi:hypothetical protein
MGLMAKNDKPTHSDNQIRDRNTSFQFQLKGVDQNKKTVIDKRDYNSKPRPEIYNIPIP